MVQQVRTVWSGFSGGPGYTNLYFADASTVDAVLDAVSQWWTDLQQVFPTSMTFSIDNAVQQIDTVTGAETGSSNGTTFVPPVSGGALNAFGPAPAGICVGWDTSDFLAGRRIRGRTFLVPVTKVAFEDNGTIAGGTLTTVAAAASALLTNADAALSVWHRPVLGTGGQVSRATAFTVRDKAAVLRSRRD